MAILLNFTAMRLVVSLLSLLSFSASAQMLVPELLTALPAQLNETSGLIVLDDAIWTILDSGAPAEVYQVDPTDGSVLRTVQLLGATNSDFEEITADANWVYVGDFGNNSGSRTNLRVYRLPRAELENESTTQIAVEVIGFSFADQTDFTPAINATNFDCEAFVAVDDSLFVFSKRWLDGRTQIYALPALPGDHVAEVRGTYDTDGVVTAASWDGTDRLVLLGHEGDPGQPFVVLLNNIQGHDFFGSLGIRRPVDLFDHQTEGIAWLTPDKWVIGNEFLAGSPAALWSVEVGQRIGEDDAEHYGSGFFPNPTSGVLQLDGVNGPTFVRIMDCAGRLLMSSAFPQNAPLDVSSLAPGRYVALITCATYTVRLPLVVSR